MTYFPKEIFTTIVDYCGETPKAKHAKTWKTIQPRIQRCGFCDHAVLIVYDKTRGKNLEWFLNIEDRAFLERPATEIVDFAVHMEDLASPDICGLWSTEEEIHERYDFDEEIDEPVY